ncbi:MAG: helix-turn-helix domain-containing protein [Rhodobacteraceae bacterium]|nr:helix-turn-helix domain-containing protein [Paracoccaceae bacterium]
MEHGFAISEGLHAGDGFAGAVRELFGNIRQRFFADPAPQERRLIFTAMGSCGLSRITAPAHGVIAGRFSRREECPDAIKVLVQVSGTSTFRQDGNRLAMRARSAVIYDPTRPYALINATSVEQFVLQIPREDLGERALRALCSPVFLPSDQSGQTMTLAALIRTSGETAAALAPELRTVLGQSLTAFAQGLIGEQFRTDMIASLDNGSLILLRERIKAFVARHLTDPDLSNELIARKMGCSVRYLHRAFEAEQTTLQKMIWTMRLEMSRSILRSPTAAPPNISEVALRCGFSSSSHFSRTFRQRFGMSPLEARARA